MVLEKTKARGSPFMPFPFLGLSGYSVFDLEDLCSQRLFNKIYQTKKQCLEWTFGGHQT